MEIQLGEGVGHRIGFGPKIFEPKPTRLEFFTRLAHLVRLESCSQMRLNTFRLTTQKNQLSYSIQK